jgi:hypothetical protein
LHVWEMEIESTITVEDRVRGRGGSDRRDWRKQAKQWAITKGWEMPIAKEEAQQGAPIPLEEAALV